MTVYRSSRSTSVTNAPDDPCRHDITLSATKALPGNDNVQTLIDQDLVGNETAPVVGAMALAPNFPPNQRTILVAA